MLAGGAAGGMERSGSLSGRACRSAEDVAMQQMRRRRCDATDAQKTLRCNRCAEAAALGARKKRRASTDRWHRKSNPAQRLVTPMPDAQEKNRVNILLTLRPATREATTCGAAHHLRSNKLRSGPPPAEQQPAERPANREATTCEAARRRRAKRYLKKSSSRYLGSGQSSSSIIISNLSALRRIFSIYGKTVLL